MAEKAIVSVTLTNEDKGHRFSEWRETVDETSMGQIFRQARAEYGRCVSKVYIELPGHAQPVHVGWYFEKRERYEDASTKDDTYLRGAWVTVSWERDDDPGCLHNYVRDAEGCFICDKCGHVPTTGLGG